MTDLTKRNKKASVIMLFGTIINFLLFGVKLWIGLASNNIAILTDAINNLGDVISCLLSLICFYLIYADKKSEKYPYGYGKLEQVSSLIMSMIIIVIGGYFFISSLNRLMIASLVQFKWLYFIILLLTVFVKIGLAIFYRLKNKNIDSDVLRCAYFDSILDASITLMTVIGLLLTKYVQLRLDGIFGIAVSIAMIIGGVKLFLSNLKSIIGTSLPPEILSKIVEKLEGSGVVEKVISTQFYDYGLGKKTLLVSAIFTKEYDHDIIKKICADIAEKDGITIKFLYEV